MNDIGLLIFEIIIIQEQKKNRSMKHMQNYEIWLDVILEC